MKKLFTLCLLVLTLATEAQVQVDLFSGMDQFLLLDTNTPVTIWGYGFIDEATYSLPAPLLVFDQGDEVTIYMENWSPESHTIHLHGLDVDQANDGVPSTSFMIPFNGNGSYSFTASEPGTYLYHCHVTTTLHLTMGMYGMVVVEYSDDQLFEDGPYFGEEFYFLFSDLEEETNQAPAQAYPFHEIHPDYFMINGLSGAQIDAQSSAAINGGGSDVALRIGSMAYSKIVIDFPDELNVKVWMSDGRALPQPFYTDLLEVFPGERFSVIIEGPWDNYEGVIPVQYYSMLNGELVGENFIPVSLTTVGVGEVAAFQSLSVSPNPTTAEVSVFSEVAQTVTVRGVDGRLVCEVQLSPGENIIPSDKWERGTYLISSEDGRQTERVIKN